MIFDLKRLQLDDMDRAAVVLRASFDDRLPWLAGLHTPDEDRAFFRNHVFPACEVWGALVDGEIVGIIAFRPGWIDQLYILPDQQGYGAGSALVALAQARSPSLQLWTFQRNDLAQRFYEAEDLLPSSRPTAAITRNESPTFSIVGTLEANRGQRRW